MMKHRRRIVKRLRTYVQAPVLLAVFGPPLAAQDLPFDPPEPHTMIQRLGVLEGVLLSCSAQFDAADQVLNTREFRVSIDRKVFDQIVSVDLLGADGDERRNPQSTLLMYDRKDDQLRDVMPSEFE